jgi:hypothetical protein
VLTRPYSHRSVMTLYGLLRSNHGSCTVLDTPKKAGHLDPVPLVSWFMRQPARALLGTGAPSSSGCSVGEPPQLRGPGVAVQTRHHIEDGIKGHWGVGAVVRCW